MPSTPPRLDIRPGKTLRGFAAAVCLLISITSAHAGQAPAAEAPPAPTNDDCAACHSDQSATRANGTPVFVDMPTFAASKHGPLACVDCHTDLATQTEWPHPEKLKPVACATCHGDVGETYDDSIHARARVRSGLNVAPTCANCHGAHDVLGKDDPKSRVAHMRVPETCGACHEGITERFNTGVHAQAMHKGNANAPSCATCHTAHNIQRVDTESARLGVLAECGTCHLSVVESYGRTFHGKVTQLGSATVAACADCHSAHEILPASHAASSISQANLPTTCGKCHTGANEKFVQYDPHPNPNDYNRNPVLWWVNRFYWVLIPGCFAFFGLHSAIWFWRARRDADRGREHHG
jgi:hypothetical protein